LNALTGRRAWLPALVALLYSVSLAYALLRFGAAETETLYRLYLPLGACALLAVAAVPLRGWAEPRRLILPIVGVLVLGQVAFQPALEGRGWTHLAVGWMALFIILWLIDQSSNWMRYLLQALIVLGGVEAIYGLIQAIGGIDYIGSYFRGRGAVATGTLINRNHFAFTLTLIFPLALGALYARYEHRRKTSGSISESWAQTWVMLLGCSFMGVGVLLSQSRGGSITLVATLLYMAILMTLRARSSARRSSSAIVWIALATVLGLGAAIGLEALLARFGRLDENLIRIEVYRDTLELIADHFWLGVGPGMYLWRFRPYQSIDAGRLYDHAHNDYLESAAEWGIPIAVVLWVCIVWLFLRSSRRFFEDTRSSRRGLALGCAAAIFSVLLHSLVDFSLQLPALLMLFSSVIGLAWGLDLTDSEPRLAVVERARRLPSAASSVADRVLRGVLIALLLAGGWSVSRHLRAERATRPDNGVEGLQRAIAIDPSNPKPHFLLGLAYRDLPGMGSASSAADELTTAVRLNPFSWRYRLELSRALELLGEQHAAETAMVESVRLNPASGEYRWRLANLQLRLGKLESALEQIGRALELEPRLRGAALALLLKSGVDMESIERIWPADRDSRIALLQALSSGGLGEENSSLLDLETQWRALAELESPPTVAESRAYISYLLERGELERARDRWIEVQELNGESDPDFADRSDLIWNGQFSLPLSGTPLGWQVSHTKGVSIECEADSTSSGGRVLRVDFDGSANLSFVGLRQAVIADGGGRYSLSYAARSKEVTTDQGPFLEVSADGGAVLFRGPMMLESSEWQRYEGEPFDLPLGVELMELRLRRIQSRRIDSKIRGHIWLDDLVLRRIDR